MTVPITLQQQINQAVSGLGQHRDALARAKRSTELLDYLQDVIKNQLSKIRREAVAEAVQWPDMSMAKVADELGISKSAVAKLVTPDLRTTMADDLRSRLANGFNPPPLRKLP
jgi:hypothetical protein